MYKKCVSSIKNRLRLSIKCDPLPLHLNNIRNLALLNLNGCGERGLLHQVCAGHSGALRTRVALSHHSIQNAEDQRVLQA